MMEGHYPKKINNKSNFTITFIIIVHNYWSDTLWLVYNKKKNPRDINFFTKKNLILLVSLDENQ